MARFLVIRLLDAAEYLAAHIHEAQVWIVPCLEGGSPTRTSGSSIYPAMQNMLLAARALGLGATLTTLYLSIEEEAEAALGLPPNVHSYALLPIGYPMGRFGPIRRITLSDVVYEDRWGQRSPVTQRALHHRPRDCLLNDHLEPTSTPSLSRFCLGGSAGQPFLAAVTSGDGFARCVPDPF